MPTAIANDQQALLTLEQAAAVLNQPLSTLRYWVVMGGPAHGPPFPTVKLGRRRMVRRTDLDTFIAAL